jgi:hypothetical protein
MDESADDSKLRHDPLAAQEQNAVFHFVGAARSGFFLRASCKS